MDDQAFALIKIVLVFGSIFGLPIIGLIAFVQLRAKSRRAALAGPWSAIAERWGGTFAADRVHCDRGDHQLSLDMAVVSVMQAASGPYYPDGGTFTKARVAVAPGGPIRIATHPAARVDAGELAGFVPAVASLPPSARVVLGEREAVVVLAGPVSDGGALNACFQSLDAIVQHARANGPIPVQAA